MLRIRLEVIWVREVPAKEGDVAITIVLWDLVRIGLVGVHGGFSQVNLSRFSRCCLSLTNISHKGCALSP